MKVKVGRVQYDRVLEEVLTSHEALVMKEMCRNIATLALFEEEDEDRMVAYLAIIASKQIVDEAYNKLKDHFEVVEESES